MVITSSSLLFHCCCWCGGRAVQSWHTTLRALRTARRGFPGKTHNSFKWLNYFSLGRWRLRILFAASNETVVEFYFSPFALTSSLLDSCAFACRSLVCSPVVVFSRISDLRTRVIRTPYSLFTLVLPWWCMTADSANYVLVDNFNKKSCVAPSSWRDYYSYP